MSHRAKILSLLLICLLTSCGEPSKEALLAGTLKSHATMVSAAHPRLFPSTILAKTRRGERASQTNGISEFLANLALTIFFIFALPSGILLISWIQKKINPKTNTKPPEPTPNQPQELTLNTPPRGNSVEPPGSTTRERTFDKSPILIPEEERWRAVEANVHNELSKLPAEYNLMSNALFRQGSRYSTQIDHIVTSTHGMFIIETKSWQGEISGNENEEEWTQNINGNSYKLYNPIRQNRGHINFLKRIFRSKGFGFLLPIFRSIVVFEDDAKLSVNTRYKEDIVHRSTLLKTILDYKDLIVTDGEKEKIEEAIEISVEANEEAEKQHVKNVKIIQILKKIARTGLCPLCGNRLKWKEDKKKYKEGDRYEEYKEEEYTYQHWICSDSNCKFDSRTSLEEIAREEVERIFAVTPNNALVSAVNAEDFEVTEYLISRGGANINTKTANGSTALIYAVKNNHRDIAKLLLENGADPNAKNKKGVTPFMWAVRNNRKDIAELLIQHGADVDARRDGGVTPFMWAMREANFLVATFLLQNNANIEAKDENGYTTLIWAANTANLDAIQFLIQNHANINAMGTNGYTPLICASMNGHLDAVKLLLKNHAAVDAKGPETVTAFVWAMKKAYLNVASFLLARHANIEAKDENDHTTLMWAANLGNVAFVQFLLERGASVHAKNKQGETPLRLAATSKTNILRKIGTILFILAYFTKD